MMILFCSQLAFAQKNVEELFVEAEEAYNQGDYPKVISNLQPLVDPVILLSISKGERAYESLGLSCFHISVKAEADQDKELAKEYQEQSKKYFSRLIRLQPSWTITSYTESPRTIAFFNQVKEEVIQEINSSDKHCRERIKNILLANTREVIVEKRQNSLLVAWMPFGIGQFQNDQPVWGGIFLGSEILSIALSAGFYLSAESLRQENGYFAPADYQHAKDLQHAQLAFGWLAVGLAAGGIIHALWNFKDQKNLHRTIIEPKSENSLSWTF